MSFVIVQQLIRKWETMYVVTKMILAYACSSQFEVAANGCRLFLSYISAHDIFISYPYHVHTCMFPTSISSVYSAVPLQGGPFSPKWGRGMGCLLWFLNLIHFLPLLSQCGMQYRDKLDRVLMILDDVYIYIILNSNSSLWWWIEVAHEARLVTYYLSVYEILMCGTPERDCSSLTWRLEIIVAL